MKTKLPFLIIGVMILFLIGSCQNKSETLKKQDAIRLGATLPLTGTAAVWGKNAKNGMELAKNEINKAGGIKGQELNIIYEDTTGVPKVGVSAISKLITTDKVQAVMGCITSSTTLAMAPIAKTNEVVLFSPGASNPKLSEAGPYFFRNFPSDAIEAPEIARMVWNKLNAKKTAILLVNNEFGKGHEQGFSAEFKKLGGAITAVESFAQEATDFRTQIAKIKSSKPEVLFVPGYPKEMSNLLRQIAEAGLKVQVVCPSALIDDELIKTAGQAVDGVIFADQRPADMNSPVVKHFYDAYREAYKEEPGIVSDTSYDTVKLIALCIEKSGYSGSGISKCLFTIRGYEGAAGVTTFDSHGDVSKTPIFKKVENSKILAYWDNPASQ